MMLKQTRTAYLLSHCDHSIEVFLGGWGLCHNTYDALPTSTPSAFPTIDTPRACSSRPQHVRRTAQVYALRLSDTRHSTCLLVTTTTRTTHCPSLRPPPSRHSTLHALARHDHNNALPKSTPSAFPTIDTPRACSTL